MKISVLCTDTEHPVAGYLSRWCGSMEARGHDASLVHAREQLPGGDLLFLVSCTEVVTRLDRERYEAALVLHASDLPRGRGWSPHIWAVLNGESTITVCLLEACERVDSGPIWLRKTISLDGSELAPEINRLLFEAELELMSEAVETFGEVEPKPQVGEPGEYLRKRTPEDSRMDPHKTLVEQFNLLRVVDSRRYPAFFDYRGHRYRIYIEKDGMHGRE